MTILVGLICKNGIAFASDSQTSSEPGTSKRTDTDKISIVEFSDGKQALIAQAGDWDSSAFTVEFLEELARNSALDDYRKPADLLQDAVRHAKERLANLNNWEDRRDLEQEYLCNNPFTFLIAYYFQNQPYLYSLNSVPGFARREFNYACAGCGSTVAEFILSRSNSFLQMEVMKGFAAAVYTVEQVKTGSSTISVECTLAVG